MNTNQELVTSVTLRNIPRPDEFISQDVIWNLTQNGEFDGRNIEVMVSQGRVVLKGEASTRHAKKLALHCVKDIRGIVHIENQIKIRRVSRFSDGHSMHGF